MDKDNKDKDLEESSLKLEKSKIIKPILGKRKVKVELDKEEITKKTKSFNKEIKIIHKRKFKKALRDFPLLMNRELRRIRWVSPFELNKKFWLTIAFIVSFAIYFAIFKSLLELIFRLIKAID